MEVLFGLIATFILSYFAYSQSPTASAIIFILGMFGVIRKLFKESSDRSENDITPQVLKPIKEVPENRAKLTREYLNEIEFPDGKCYLCNGLGYIYSCEHCGSEACLGSHASEYYEPELYCSECLNKGKEAYDIKETLCYECAAPPRRTKK